MSSRRTLNRRREPLLGSVTPPPEPPQGILRSKVGIGSTGNSSVNTAVRNAGFAWSYNWQAFGAISGVEYIPMIWGADNVGSLAFVSSSAPALLGFNEPDHPDQSNMTVATAISLWPQLMAKNVRLGSPATAGSATQGWQANFMAQATSLGYRVDFMAVHVYSGGTNSVQPIKNHLQAVYDKYGKPIWLTEYALINWANIGQWNAAQNAAYAQAMLEMLDTLPFVERHAWFSANPMTGLVTHLFTDAGARTVIGDTFAAAIAGGH